MRTPGAHYDQGIREAEEPASSCITAGGPTLPSMAPPGRPPFLLCCAGAFACSAED
jgi:hypothetical protein